MMALLLLPLKCETSLIYHIRNSDTLLMLKNEQQVKRNHILIFLIQKRIGTVLHFAMSWKLLGRGWCDGEAGIFRPVLAQPRPDTGQLSGVAGYSIDLPFCSPVPPSPFLHHRHQCPPHSECARGEKNSDTGPGPGDHPAVML